MAARRASEASQYLLRAPFSLEKITWNEKTQKVIYRSKRSWHTKKNYQIFSATDFIAATVEHIPPKSQQCHAAKAVANKRSEIAWTEPKAKSNGALLRTLFEQEPRLGGKIGKSPPAVEGIIRGRPCGSC